MFAFENLTVYQEALSLMGEIYRLISKWPRVELYALTDQLRRAVSSIVLNIAEGSSRTNKDFSHFLDMSKGSIYESVAILQIALKENYIDKEEYKNFYEKLDKLSRKITQLKKHLLQNIDSGHFSLNAQR